MRRLAFLPALIALLLFPTITQAKDPSLRSFAEAGTLTAEIIPAKAKRGETVTYRVTMTPNKANHVWTYPITPKDKLQEEKTKIVAPDAGDLIFVTEAQDPAGFPWSTKPGETILGEPYTKQFSLEPVTWEMKAVVSPLAEPGEKTITLNERRTRFQGCNDENCVFSRPDNLPKVSFEVLPGEPVAVDAQYKEAVEKAIGPPSPKIVTPPTPGAKTGDPKQPRTPDKPDATSTKDYGPKPHKPIEQYEQDLTEVRENLDTSELADAVKQDESIGGFVLTAVLWGLISLVTPCVFPMIPITVSIFMKHAHGSFRERLKLASVYCLTIIVVLGLSAFALLRFMAVLSAHPATNIFLGALFLVLALSLFGMYELTLPNFMSRRLQAKQSQGGTLGMVFGALAFTVISFTCVAPFLGGFAGISAADSGNTDLVVMPTTKEIFGGLAFATAFAAPFFILAMIPGLLKALPKSGGWLDSVKVVMGFLELAAALKFFRTAELRVFSPVEFFTYDLVLAGWVGICFACGLYLLNAYRLPHDEEKPNIGVLRMLFAVTFLGLGLYLLPGMFRTADNKTQRPNGAIFAWVDAFLLPEPHQPSPSGDESGWSSDLHDTIMESERDENGNLKPIFLDFTGVTCTNCKYNENNVFPQPQVKAILDEYQLVQLYTDEVPAGLFLTDPGKDARDDEGTANDDFKFNVFKDQRLPLYAVIVPTPDGSGKPKARLLGTYPEGKINAPDEFAAWLREMQEKAKGDK